jgi:hypothetical protein
MGVFLHPEQPDFATDSEREAWKALKGQLRDGDALLHGIRITDPVDGDIEIDLLVLMPERGAAVVEVKGGLVTYAEGKVTQSDAYGDRTIDPFTRAMQQMHSLRRYIEHAPTWSRGHLRAAWLACFPHTVVTGAMGPQGPREVLIGKEDLPDAAEIIEKRLGNRHDTTRVPAEGWVGDVIDLLLGPPRPQDIPSRVARRLARVDELAAQQEALLSFVSPNPKYVVTGSAGTGKTWLAVEQARRWAKDGKRVAFVTYGRGVVTLVQSLADQMSARERPDFIGTFHQLGYRWGVHAPPGADQDYWDVEIPRQMIEATAMMDPGQRFDAFVVDEAQDFADAWWPALLSSAKSIDDVHLAIFRDDEQAVFKDRAGRPDIDLTPFALDRNLRNAKEIVDVFRPLISSNPRARAGEGLGVEFVPCSREEVIRTADDVVEDLFDQRGWLPDDIALITTAHRHDIQKEKDHDKDAYWASLWDNDVFHGTVAGFKGLERPAVVLAVDGFHPGVDPAQVIYVGMSRARDLLVVVGDPQEIEGAVGSAVMKRLRDHSRLR